MQAGCRTGLLTVTHSLLCVLQLAGRLLMGCTAGLCAQAVFVVVLHRPFTPDTCCFAQVLDGELAQRAEATRRLREVQKQLMLLGGLVPPSPVVTAAAAAAARGRRNSGNPLSSGGGARGSSSGGQPEEATLMQEAKALQDAIDGHTRSVKVCVRSGSANRRPSPEPFWHSSMQRRAKQCVARRTAMLCRPASATLCCCASWAPCRSCKSSGSAHVLRSSRAVPAQQTCGAGQASATLWRLGRCCARCSSRHARSGHRCGRGST